MKVVTSPGALQKIIQAHRRRGHTIGVVPTMGFLHDGHLSLLKKARASCDVVVLTLFVNPTQFGPKEDLSRYPRDKKGDLAKARSVKTDYVFCPTVAQMYPKDEQTRVVVSGTTQTLCGASRPGHFEGVTTVVAKLFNITLPDKAFFGLKDYQQFATIRQMVRDLNFPIDVVGVPTVRETDGLAMSSRNAYLNGSEREAALCLSRGLKKVKVGVKEGKNVGALLKILEKEIKLQSLARIDYVSCVNATTLLPTRTYLRGNTLFALAVFIGKTRLIDNLVV